MRNGIESETDTHVFRHYALTPAEIELVKGSTATTGKIKFRVEF